MLDPEDYRRRAQDCFDRAKNETGRMRQTFLKIANAWLTLARHVEAEAELLRCEAPLVPSNDTES